MQQATPKRNPTSFSGKVGLQQMANAWSSNSNDGLNYAQCTLGSHSFAGEVVLVRRENESCPYALVTPIGFHAID